MYAKGTSIQLPGSPSLQTNNLNSSSGSSLTFVRLNEAYLLQLTGECFKIPHTRSKIYQVIFADILNTNVLIIASNLGIQIWSSAGDNMIFHYPISSLPGIDGDEDRFFRGLTCIGEYVCCGSSSGNILVFNCGSISKSSDFSLVHNLESESLIAITALSSSRSTLVAGNDEGKLFGYKVDEAFELGFTFDGTGFPCTSLQQGGNILYAAYASGHIRIFRTDIVELAIEIAAHARCITGLALHPKLNMLCSCALDQYVMVWSTPDFKSAATSNMTLIYSDSLENRLCTGVAYLSNDSICVSSYDDDELFVLTSK